MNAALAFTLDLPRPKTALAVAPSSAVAAPAPALPSELVALFDESAKVKASFWRLEDRDRRGFVRYIDEAGTPATRERRAAIVAMSLVGLARDLDDAGR